MATPHGTIEVLENRIAPAVFFVSAAAAGANALTVHKGSALAGISADEVEARNFAGSTQAVLLSKGDVLVLDVDDNLALSAGDITLMTVTSGKAMVFLTDTEFGAAGAFDVDDLTGIAYGKDFAATVKTSIGGDVLGGLTDAGKLNLDGTQLNLVPGANLKGLDVTGNIFGNLQGGGNINGVKITSTGGNLSVTGIFTGNQKTDAATLNGTAENEFSLGYAPALGANGGNISNITLSRGALILAASDGYQAATGKAGTGGSISNITYQELGGIAGSNFRIEAGDAGGSSTPFGTVTPGLAGSISNVSLSGGSLESSIEIRSGTGGSSANAGSNGGNISNLTINLTEAAGELLVSAGDGGSLGQGLKAGKAGAGGSLSKIKVTGTSFADDFSLYSGSGGDSSPFSLGTGGAGGNITDVSITAGSGGLLELYAGDAGVGLKSAGAGGSISKVVANLTGVFEYVEITGGAGGATLGDKAAASAGGSVSAVTLKVNEITDYVSIYGGEGGSSLVGAAGAGGAISGLSVVATGTIGTSSTDSDPEFLGLEIISGDGGIAGAVQESIPVLGGGPNSKAGASGALSKISVQGTTIAFIEVSSGVGGSGAFGAALGAGNSGAISTVDIVLTEGTVEGGHVHSGTGGGVALGSGNGGFGAGNGGSSGALKDISIKTGADDFNRYEIYAGVPSGDFSGGGKTMAALLPGYKGGSIGAITDVQVEAPGAAVYIGKAVEAGFGGILPGGASGSGGDVTKIRVTASLVGIAAASGGFGVSAGGKGGSVKDVNVTITPGDNNYLHYVIAGDGGAGLKPGLAGSVSNILTEGNIGNIFAADGYAEATEDGYLPLSSIGGIFAGRGYKILNGLASAQNGNVTNVTAKNISAIMAGVVSGNNISAGNAVFQIAKITAQKIGADLDGDMEFGYEDENENGLFDLGTDTPTDGVVIVKQGGYVGASVNVLKLIQVTPEELEDISTPGPF